MHALPQNNVVLSATLPTGMKTSSADCNSRECWLARMQLGYERTPLGTRLATRSHVGPLSVQKPLYPEGPDVCHSLILHPPGGIAGNDLLEVDLAVGKSAHALVTMPGATKWYRTLHEPAMQRLHARIADEAILEWLPPETIVFDRATARMETSIELDGGTYLGWEILCLGRTHSGERYDAGSIRQLTTISSGGRLLWSERSHLHGGSRLLAAASGLRGNAVSAIFIAAGRKADAGILAQCRAVPLELPARSGITALPEVLVARYLGPSSEQAKSYFIALWRILRPHFAGREAITPRIWAT